MKKIAIFIDSELNGTGVSQYIKSLLYSLINLSEDNFSVSVLFTREGWDNKYDKYPFVKFVYLKKNGLLNIFYQLLISLGNIVLAKFIARKFDSRVKFIENKNYDFVIFPSGDSIAILINSNVIATIHDLMHRYETKFKESGGLLIYYYRENYYKNLLLSSIAVLVDSQLGAKQVFDSYKKINSKVFILPYIAPDYIYFNELHNISSSNRQLLQSRFIFYPAAFWPHKNHLNLLKAINLLKERGQIINLYLAGEKRKEFKKLKRYVINKNLTNQVIFLGYVSDIDITDFYRNAYALIMPTFFGPTNIPPIEAILLNCPLIVSDNYAMREQFEDAAIYFNPSSIFEIADSIELMLTNLELRNNLIQNGVRIREKYSQKRFETDVIDILKKLSVYNSSK